MRKHKKGEVLPLGDNVLVAQVIPAAGQLGCSLPGLWVPFLSCTKCRAEEAWPHFPAAADHN